MSFGKKVTGNIFILAFLMLLLISCPPPEGVIPPTAAPTAIPFQLTVQVEKEMVVDTARTSEITVQGGAATTITAVELANHVFTKWEIVSGAGAVLGDAFQTQTTVTAQENTVIKAIYLTAYHNPFNEHYYKLIPIVKTWPEAKIACEGIGGYLVTITSKEEQDL